ncbi:MAG: hypothetical protein JWO02_3277 [Solirubrobacterales bacterium]|nr:hypothetical protein [Solirubrobacterales bacterium]
MGRVQRLGRVLGGNGPVAAVGPVRPRRRDEHLDDEEADREDARRERARRPAAAPAPASPPATHVDVRV